MEDNKITELLSKERYTGMKITIHERILSEGFYVRVRKLPIKTKNELIRHNYNFLDFEDFVVRDINNVTLPLLILKNQIKQELSEFEEITGFYIDHEPCFKDLLDYSEEQDAAPSPDLFKEKFLTSALRKLSEELDENNDCISFNYDILSNTILITEIRGDLENQFVDERIKSRDEDKDVFIRVISRDRNKRMISKFRKRMLFGFENLAKVENIDQRKKLRVLISGDTIIKQLKESPLLKIDRAELIKMKLTFGF